MEKLFAGWARLGKKAETKPKIIHPYQRQISNKIYQSIFKAALFEFNCILFKILLIKNIPKPHLGAWWMGLSFIG